MSFSWKNFHWNNRLTGLSKPCLTSAISWQDFRKVVKTDDDWMVLNKLNPDPDPCLFFDGVDDKVEFPDLDVSNLPYLHISIDMEKHDAADSASFEQFVDGDSYVQLLWHTNGSVYGVVRDNSTSYGYVYVGDTGRITATIVFQGSETGNENRLQLNINGVQQTLTFVGTIPSATPDLSSANPTLGLQAGGCVKGIVHSLLIRDNMGQVIHKWKTVEENRYIDSIGGDDGVITGASVEYANAVQVVGQYEGHFDGIGYAESDANLGNAVKVSIKATFKKTASQICVLSQYLASTNVVGLMWYSNGAVVLYAKNGGTRNCSVIFTEYTKEHEFEAIFDGSQPTDELKAKILIDGVEQSLTYGGTGSFPSQLDGNLGTVKMKIGKLSSIGSTGIMRNIYICRDGVNILDLDFSTGKENKIYSKDPTANHATLVNMDLINFWQQGEGKPTLALEGCNYSTATGYIPARNDGSGLDALGNPIQIKPLDWANLPLYSFRYPSSLPIMDKVNTANWSDNTGGLDWSYAQLKSIPEIKKAPVQDMVFMKDVRLDKKMQEILITDTPQAGACLDKTKKWTGLGK